MFLHLLQFIRFAPADNGSGEPTPTAPAAGADTSSKLVKMFEAEEQAKVAAKAPQPAPEEVTDDPTPAEPAPEAPAAEAPDEGDDIAPVEGISPERAAQQQKGIDKLKAARDKARQEAESLKAQLAELQAKLDTPPAATAEPDPATPPTVAPAPVAGTLDPLFLATNASQIDAEAITIQRAILRGEEALEDIRDGEEPKWADGTPMTREEVRGELRKLKERQLLIPAAREHITARQRAEGLAAKQHPSFFQAGKPKPELQAALREFPELAARPDGLAIVADILSARRQRQGAPTATPATPAKAPATRPAPARVPPAPAASASSAGKTTTATTFDAKRFVASGGKGSELVKLFG